MASNLLGSIEQFDLNSGNWNEYVEHLEQYLIANEIVDPQKKVAVFLTIIGSETYSLLRNLLAPVKPATRTFEDLIGELKKHLNPTPIVIAERYKFYDRQQKRDETLSEYMAALRKLTEHCEFGGFLNEAHKYVCGLPNASIRKRLLAERTLDLQRAIEISQGLEQAQNQSDLISTNYAHTEDFTNKLSQVHSQRNRTPSRSCYRCACT